MRFLRSDWIAALWLAVLIALLPSALRAGASQDEQKARPLEMAQGELDKLTARVDVLETRLAELDALVREIAGEPGIDPPPVEPPVDPPPTGERWPVAQDVRVDLRVARMAVQELAMPPPRSWELEEGWRHATTWLSAADLHLRAFWEQTARGDSWVSVQVVNAYASVGVVELAGLRVSVAGAPVLEVGALTLPPRTAAPWATTRPTTAAGWDWMDDPRPFAPWSEQRAQEELQRRERNVLLGIWPFWWNDVDQATGDPVPRDPAAPAGYGLAPGDGGAGDWLVGPWGKACRWGWVLGESWKGMWFLDRETGEPVLRDVEYWTGREPQQFSDLGLPGYLWEPANALQRQLDQQTRPSDGPHYRRTWGGAAADAPWSAPCRWVAKMAAYDMLQDWHIQPGQSRDGNLLTGGLVRRIAQAANGSLVPPRANGLLGSRYLAQAIYCLVEARGVLEPAVFDQYAEALIAFGLLLTSPDGVCNRDTGGDTGQYVGPPWNLRGPLCSTFHQKLVCGAYLELGRCGFPEATALGERMARFLGTQDTAYGVEAWQTGTARDTWSGRKHSAAASLPANQRRWSPDRGSYAAFTHGILPSNWSSLEELDAAARSSSVEENPLAVVPRSVWEEMYR